MSDENHSRFQKHLASSHDAVLSVAFWLNSRGHEVTIPPSSVAGRHSEWKDHADNGDLFIKSRVEVKHLGVNFTSSLDWPFGDKFIVCAKHAFDRAIPKPQWFVIVSEDMRTAAIADSRDSREWYVEVRKDSRYEGVSQQFYLSPIELVKWINIGSTETEE